MLSNQKSIFKAEGKRAAFLGCLPPTWQVPQSGACRYFKKEETTMSFNQNNFFNPQGETGNHVQRRHWGYYGGGVM